MNNYLIWFSLVTRFASIVAREEGVAPRELAYLSLLTSGVQLMALTSSELAALEAKYEAERGTPVTVDELAEIEARIKARSERIQSA